MSRSLRFIVPLSVVVVVSTLVAVRPASAATQAWSLTPVHPSVVLYSPYSGEETHTGDIRIEGGLHDTGDAWLSATVPDVEGGTRRPLFILSGRIGLLARPRTFRLPSSGLSFQPTPTGGICSYGGDGLLDLEDIGFDAAGRVARLSLDYALSCDGGGDTQHGSVRWGYGADRVAPAAYTFPATPVHDFYGGLWVTVPSSSVWSPTSLRLAGPNAADFIVATGITCAQNGPCRVLVRFFPNGGGYRRADLVLEGDGGSARIPLEGIGLPGVSDMSVLGEPTITPEDGLVRFSAYLGSRTTSGIFAGDASPNDPTLPSYSVIFTGPVGERLHTGIRYTDTGTAPDGNSPDGTNMSLARRQDAGSPWISCGDTGWFEFRQLFARTGDAPAYVVDFHSDCYGKSYDGTIRYGARPDVTEPAPAGRLRLADSDTLAWTTPADAVRSVVRIRRGGLATPTADTGQLLYSGPAKTVTIPARYVGGSVSFTVFTVDATGNVSSPAAVVTRGAARVTITGTAGAVSGSVLDRRWGYRLVGTRLVLERWRDGSWHRIATSASDRVGRYRFGVRHGLRRSYRVRALATRTHRAGVSRSVRAG